MCVCVCVCVCVKQKEYRKDLEQEVKGKGLMSLEETPDLLRVKNAGHILSEVHLFRNTHTHLYRNTYTFSQTHL